ncbi:hypothetical protein D4764_03G0009630 [Takifugu flavidus]|uniref:Uncharacterized protein n=1 Tax=Takifugu flavidus TaxID=433684 RepID=A0A5C6NA41_9TELE|nr:hypothetical protein D4764_03G0009630 [Takifugu flavidus]
MELAAAQCPCWEQVAAAISLHLQRVSLPSFALSAFVPVPLLQSAMPANEHQHKAIIQPSSGRGKPPPPIKRRCRGCQLMQSFIEDAEIIVDGDESHRTGDEPRIHFRHSLWDVHTYIGAQTSTPPPPIPHPPTSRVWCLLSLQKLPCPPSPNCTLLEDDSPPDLA